MPTLESHILISESTEGRHLVANPYFYQVDTAGNQLPYISEQDEIFVNEDEVRLLKLVNAEVDFKAQSLQLSTAPLLLENQEKGDLHGRTASRSHAGDLRYQHDSRETWKSARCSAICASARPCRSRSTVMKSTKLPFSVWVNPSSISVSRHPAVRR